MPEVHMQVRWPDGSTQRCYSPSLVVTEHLEQGATYPLADFLERARTSLSEASERVRQIHGFPCGRAAATLADIERQARHFGDDAGAAVVVEGFDRTP